MSLGEGVRKRPALHGDALSLAPSLLGMCGANAKYAVRCRTRALTGHRGDCVDDNIAVRQVVGAPFTAVLVAARQVMA